MKKQKLKAAMIALDDNWFDIILKNDSGTNYKRINTLSGAVLTDDDGILETSKALKDEGPLPSGYITRISGTDLDELEMLVWFNVDAYREVTEAPEQFMFFLPRWTYFLGGQADVEIDLDPRTGETIDEMVKHINMAGGYTKTSEVDTSK